MINERSILTWGIISLQKKRNFQAGEGIRGLSLKWGLDNLTHSSGFNATSISERCTNVSINSFISPSFRLFLIRFAALSSLSLFLSLSSSESLQITFLRREGCSQCRDRFIKLLRCWVQDTTQSINQIYEEFWNIGAKSSWETRRKGNIV